MGLRSFLGLPDKAINAQLTPPVMGSSIGTNFNSYLGPTYFAPVTRNEAMSVPSMARARNLICGVIGTIPLELFDKKTGEKIDQPPPWIDQPDTRQPRSSTIAWTVDSLLFHPVAYWEQITSYADGRPAEMAWVSNDRVTVKLKDNNTVVDYYMVDGNIRPNTGNGSLITFQSVAGDGVLITGANILRQAIDTQNAAALASATPQATGHLKNNGADLPEDKILALKAQWKANRQANAVSYLSQTIDFIPNAFSPKDMMYNEAIQYQATQIARLCNLAGFWLDAEVISSTTYQNRVDVRQDLVDLSLRAFIASIEDRLSMDDICPRGQVVRFAVDETFLRNDPITRLTVIEKLLTLGLIDTNDAKEMEGLVDGGNNSPALTLVPNQADSPNTPSAMGDA